MPTPETTTPQLSESEVAEIEARMNKTPEGPWFAAADAAKECGPHRDSGLALVDTGRDSDWPIARLCEWHKAQFIAHSREDMAALIRDWRALRAENELAGKVLKFILPNHPLATITELAKPVLDEVDRLRQAESERKIAVRYLSKQGFARCDQPEHGCDGWHERLTP